MTQTKQQMSSIRPINSKLKRNESNGPYHILLIRFRMLLVGVRKRPNLHMIVSKLIRGQIEVRSTPKLIETERNIVRKVQAKALGVALAS